MIGTGFDSPSANIKTGPMIQTWILRQDKSPREAIASNDDYSICGDCQHRGSGAGRDRSCYVDIGKAPSNIWKKYAAGGYEVLPDLRLLAQRPLRLGAYGDPAAVPVELVLSWCSAAAGEDGRARHTGYTHQWRDCDLRFRDACMASVDSDDEHRLASSMGYRTFRVRHSTDLALLEREVVCPASAERGQLLQCAACLACGGAGSGRRGHIAISVHGSRAVTNAFDRRLQNIPVRIAA